MIMLTALLGLVVVAWAIRFWRMPPERKSAPPAPPTSMCLYTPAMHGSGELIRFHVRDWPEAFERAARARAESSAAEPAAKLASKRR